MRLQSGASVAAFAAAVSAKSLADVCTLSNVKSALPSNGTLLGINLILSILIIWLIHHFYYKMLKDEQLSAFIWRRIAHLFYLQQLIVTAFGISCFITFGKV